LHLTICKGFYRHRERRCGFILLKKPEAEHSFGGGCFLEDVAGGFYHCCVHHAVSEIGKQFWLESAKHYIVSPFRERREEEACARRNRADAPSRFEHLSPAIHKRTKDVVVAIGVDFLGLCLELR
jgi:hypothetical protein